MAQFGTHMWLDQYRRRSHASSAHRAPGSPAERAAQCPAQLPDE